MTTEASEKVEFIAFLMHPFSVWDFLADLSLTGSISCDTLRRTFQSRTDFNPLKCEMILLPFFGWEICQHESVLRQNCRYIKTESTESRAEIVFEFKSRFENLPIILVNEEDTWSVLAFILWNFMQRNLRKSSR